MDPVYNASYLLRSILAITNLCLNIVRCTNTFRQWGNLESGGNECQNSTVTRDAATTDLDALLALARDADPNDRIEFRDPIAAYDDFAIEAMTDWLGDARLAAFAIRVLERIGRSGGKGSRDRTAVIDVLSAVDREELPPHLAGDVEQALTDLGASRRRAPRPAPEINAGIEGRGYWVMRTSPWDRTFIWSEARTGRLRQGWGWDESQNLEVIADIVRRGGQPSELQHLAWRARRMRTTAPDGMRVGDLIVAPNLPAWGELSIFRLLGSYSWEPVDIGKLDRFGHVLPVALLSEAIHRRDTRVSQALRSMLRVQTRLYNITPYGGDVERLVAL